MRRAFNALALLLVVGVAAVMVSAFQRMSLYVDQFGLTELRFYPTVFMFWIAILLAWFVLTLLRGKDQYYWFGAILSAYAIGFALHAVNPDRWIAQYNIARAERLRSLDVTYLASLSPDAWETIDQSWVDWSISDRVALAKAWVLRRNQLAQRDWRSWSWSSAQAAACFDQRRKEYERWAKLGQ